MSSSADSLPLFSSYQFKLQWHKVPSGTGIVYHGYRFAANRTVPSGSLSSTFKCAAGLVVFEAVNDTFMAE